MNKFLSQQQQNFSPHLSIASYVSLCLTPHLQADAWQGSGNSNKCSSQRPHSSGNRSSSSRQAATQEAC